MHSKRFFISMYILSYIGFSFVMTNFTPFLSQLGYDTAQRGILLSSYAITTILFQFLFGILSDRYQTIKKIVILSLVGYALVSCLLFQQHEQALILHMLMIALSGGLVNTCCGLYDTWVLSSSQKTSEWLSFIKAFGSIGWAIGSLLSSYIVIRFSYAGIGYTVCILLILLLLNIHFLGDITTVVNKKKISLQDVLLLCKDKTYCLMLLILFLMYAVVIANNCTVIDKMIALGASNAQISLKWSMQSILEIPTYMIGTILLRKFQPVSLLKVSAIGISIQFLCFSFSQSITMMIVMSMFQVLSTPLILIASKTMIFKLSEPHMRGTSQLVALSIFTGISSLVVPVVSGFLCLYIGIDMTLLCAASLSLLALVLLPVLHRLLQLKEGNMNKV